MQPLWAPWRMEFIAGAKPDECIFCKFPKETGDAADRRNFILARTPHSFAILNRFPYNSGHLMVIPLRHTADFTSLSVSSPARHGMIVKVIRNASAGAAPEIHPDVESIRLISLGQCGHGELNQTV
jgi:ATP adenylyltransferase